MGRGNVMVEKVVATEAMAVAAMVTWVQTLFTGEAVLSVLSLSVLYI